MFRATSNPYRNLATQAELVRNVDELRDQNTHTRLSLQSQITRVKTALEDHIQETSSTIVDLDDQIKDLPKAQWVVAPWFNEDAQPGRSYVCSSTSDSHPAAYITLRPPSNPNTADFRLGDKVRVYNLSEAIVVISVTPGVTLHVLPLGHTFQGDAWLKLGKNAQLSLRYIGDDRFMANIATNVVQTS